jgi:hypothetical protein
VAPSPPPRVTTVCAAGAYGAAQDPIAVGRRVRSDPTLNTAAAPSPTPATTAATILGARRGFHVGCSEVVYLCDMDGDVSCCSAS